MSSRFLRSCTGSALSAIGLPHSPGGNRIRSEGEIAALFWDLQAQALRGIVLSVAALAWHGLGFDPGCSRDVALKVLGLLREKGPMTLRDLQRNARLQSVEVRDALLERLAGEDLVRVEAKTVTAATCAEFVQALHDRLEFPPPANCWAAAAGGDEDKAEVGKKG